MAAWQPFAPRGNRSYIVEPDGTIRVDPAKKHIVPFTLGSEPPIITVPAATPFTPGDLTLLRGGTVVNPVIFPIDNKGPFEICYSSFRAFSVVSSQLIPTDQFLVVIFDPGFRPLLMNREIHARTMAGGFGDPKGAGFSPAIANAGGRPFVWPETYFMEPEEEGKALFMGFRNLTQNPIQVQWTFHGLRYYDLHPYEEALKEREAMIGKGRVSFPYFYTTDTDVVLDIGQQKDFDVRLTDEADVEIFKMTAFSDFPFLWRIMEKAGERFLDTAGQGVAGAANGVHSDLGWGSGEFPFIPFETMYFEQNYKVILRLSNTLAGAAVNRIWPTFTCRKIEHKGEEAKVA